MAGKRKYSHEQELAVIKLKGRGATTAQIVSATGVPERSVQAMIQRFKGIFKELENIDDFEFNRSAILTASELQVLKSIMSQERLDSAKLGELAKTFHVIHQAGRLAKGLSTTNVESKSFTEIRTTSFKE